MDVTHQMVVIGTKSVLRTPIRTRTKARTWLMANEEALTPNLILNMEHKNASFFSKYAEHDHKIALNRKMRFTVL